MTSLSQIQSEAREELKEKLIKNGNIDFGIYGVPFISGMEVTELESFLDQAIQKAVEKTLEEVKLNKKKNALKVHESVIVPANHLDLVKTFKGGYNQAVDELNKRIQKIKETKWMNL